VIAPEVDLRKFRNSDHGLLQIRQDRRPGLVRIAMTPELLAIENFIDVDFCHNRISQPRAVRPEVQIVLSDLEL
jgi:hypothetical protein